MAAWKTDQDIARDMDILSGIRSEGKVKPYSSWGRGQNLRPDIPVDIDTFPDLQEKSSGAEFEWFQEKRNFEKFPDSLSRGRKLEILKENCHRGRDLEVHEQLRAAVGHGYSNAFIEAAFKQRFTVKNDNQFDDSEASQPVHSVPLNDGNGIVGPSGGISPEHAETTTSEVQGSKENKKKTRKRRRYRNVAMESLEKLNASENSNAIGVPLDKDGRSSNGKLFGGRESSIPPAGYLPGQSCTISFSHKVSDNAFEYDESDFPNL